MQIAALRAYGALGTLGTAVAVRRRLPARLLWLRFPGSVAAQAATIGTGISAPIGMLGIAGLGARRLAPTTARRLAALFLVGALGEPVSWKALRRPRRDSFVTAIVVGNLALPAAVLLGARRRSDRPSRTRRSD